MEANGQLHVPGALPRWKNPRYLFGKGSGGPKSRSWHGGEEKNPCFCWESNPGRLAPCILTMLNDLSRHHEKFKIILMFGTEPESWRCRLRNFVAPLTWKLRVRLMENSLHTVRWPSCNNFRLVNVWTLVCSTTLNFCFPISYKNV
jgi:hypothetical protein